MRRRRHTLACGGLRGGSAAGATVTLVVDEPRALAVALNGGPPCEAAVRLPRAVRAWILLQHLGDAVALVGCDELPPDAGKPRAPPSSKGKRDESSPRHTAKRGDAPRPDRLSRATTSLSDDRYADGRRSAPHSVVGSTSSVRSVGSVGSAGSGSVGSGGRTPTRARRRLDGGGVGDPIDADEWRARRPHD